MTSSALQALRAATSEAHSRLDQGLDLPRHVSRPDRRAALVARFQGFQVGIEAAIGRRLDGRTELAMAHRRRADRFTADLAELGGARRPRPCPIPPARSDAEALGLLYVSEGSTLGAAFLFKEARDRLGLSETFGARNLAAYPQ